jgi:hypothetical protein
LKSPNVRLSSSLALILLFHRLLRRFFLRIRESLLSNEARSFRRRNPRISRSLTSKLAPAIGSSLAGFFLAVSPNDQLRVTIAIYIMTRALEFGYNYLEELGYLKNRPSWFGSWMIMPVACGQLLHAFVFDRDCFPASFGGHILDNSPAYIQTQHSRQLSRNLPPALAALHLAHPLPKRLDTTKTSRLYIPNNIPRTPSHQIPFLCPPTPKRPLLPPHIRPILDPVLPEDSPYIHTPLRRNEPPALQNVSLLPHLRDK